MTTRPGSDKATLEWSFTLAHPMDVAVAEKSLKEAKQILDGLGVVFVLSSGTCLGATRDNAFIPWDDDVDLITVIGLNGVTEQSGEIAAAAFKDVGYYVQLTRGDNGISMSMMRDYFRLSLECFRIIDDHILHFPRIRMPLRFFDPPKEIEFMGEKFLVPNPPEEYLRLKYGAEWKIPKIQALAEKDVVVKIPDAVVSGSPARVRVLDHAGKPVSGAEVVLAGAGRSRTDERGYTEVILPGTDWYALVIRYGEHEEVLYMERIGPDRTYVYRADPTTSAGRYQVLTSE